MVFEVVSFFVVCTGSSFGRVELYTVFMVFALTITLVKTLAKNLVKTCPKLLSDKLSESCPEHRLKTYEKPA